MKSFNQARVGFTLLCLTISLFIESNIVLGSLRCERDQSSPINQGTTLDCTITGRYYGVYWYVGETRDSIIRYINGQKAGSEYQSGKLDIASNGSMIINNVSVNDEGTYRVMVVWREGGDDSAYVDLTVIVQSSRDIPVIDRCDDTASCHLCIDHSVVLECSMDGRPAVDLKWYNITSGIPLDNQNLIESFSFPTYISFSRIEIHIEFLEIMEIVCVPSGLAVTLPGSAVKNASVLLVTPSDPHGNLNETYYLHVWNAPKVVGQHTSNTVAWIKQTSNVDYSYKTPTCTYLGRSVNGLLTLHVNRSNFEGIYTQVVQEGRDMFRRYMFPARHAVAPMQTHFIEQCSSQHSRNCSVTINGTRTLTCSLNFTRPAGKLTWTVKQPGPLITERSSSSSCEHDRCNTSINITFRFVDARADTAEFECLVSGPWYESPVSSFIKVFNNKTFLPTRPALKTNPSTPKTFSPTRPAVTTTPSTPSEQSTITICAVDMQCTVNQLKIPFVLMSLLFVITLLFVLALVIIVIKNKDHMQNFNTKLVMAEVNNGFDNNEDAISKSGCKENTVVTKL